MKNIFNRSFIFICLLVFSMSYNLLGQEIHKEFLFKFTDCFSRKVPNVTLSVESTANGFISKKIEAYTYVKGAEVKALVDLDDEFYGIEIGDDSFLINELKAGIEFKYGGLTYHTLQEVDSDLPYERVYEAGFRKNVRIKDFFINAISKQELISTGYSISRLYEDHLLDNWATYRFSIKKEHNKWIGSQDGKQIINLYAIIKTNLFDLFSNSKGIVEMLSELTDDYGEIIMDSTIRPTTESTDYIRLYKNISRKYNVSGFAAG